MKAFLKALRYAWPYRGRILMAWLCALLGACLWAGSLGTAGPLFSVLFQEPAKGVRYFQRPIPGDKDSDHKEWALEVSHDYEIEPDPAVHTFRVDGKRVYVNPALPVVHAEKNGLGTMARQAEEAHRPYAPAVRWLADRLPDKSYYTLLAILGGVVLMSILRGGLTYLNEYLVGHAINRSMLALRLRVYDHVLRAPLGLFARTGAADIMSRFQNDCFLIQEGTKTLLGNVFREPVRLALCLAPALYVGISIDPWLPVIVLVAAPVIGFLVRRLAVLMRRTSRKALESWAVVLAVLEESLFGIRVVKGYRLEAHERRKFFQGSRRLFKQILRAIRIDAGTNPLVETIFTLAAAGAVAMGGKLAIDRGFSEGTLSDLTIFFALLAGTLDPIRKLSNVSNRLQQAAAGSDRVFELLQTEMEPRYGLKGKDLPLHSRTIEFRHVGFAYQPGKPVVRDVNLTVKHGEVLAIIGRTGCGKTTLVSLVPRFFEPTEGGVLIDGVDTREVTLRSLRDQIAVVPQESILFADSVANNIALGASQASRTPPSRQAIETAAQAAHADAFVRQLPEGYDTLIGAHGTTLSGGERQRLALARAIIRNPSILILDEATSALDEETQALVQETLQQFVRGRTTLLIAHRLSTLSIAHRIAVMDAGRIVDVGTHEELLGRCDLYRRLREGGLDGA